MSGGRHRQHMHMLLELRERFDFSPDIIIFYNGVNELIVDQDPRATYPFHAYCTELSEWKRFFIKYSAVVSTLEYRYNILSRKDKLKERIGYMSDEYKRNLINSYFETFEYSKNISDNIKSKYFGSALFFGFFQPFKDEYYGTSELSKIVKSRINNFSYLYYTHEAFDKLDQNVWIDECHVRGEAHQVMSEIITDVILNKLKTSNLLKNTNEHVKN